MKMKIAFIVAVGFTLLNLASCKDQQALGPDEELYNEAIATSGYTFYQSNATIRTSSSATGHRPYMRVRFNSIAQNALGLDGRLPVGFSFPNGSVIVKELYDNAVGSVQLYAVMKKDSLNPYAANNWLWGEYYSESTVAISVTENGSQCINCHSTDSRDYVRLFNIF